MARLNYVFFSIVVFFSLFAGYILFNLNYQSISAHASSQADVGLYVESDVVASCGDSICNSTETCTTCSTDCGACASGSSSGSGGGGGGGGGGKSTPNFIANPENFNIQLVSGTSESNQIVVENKGGLAINVEVTVSGIDNYISLDKNSLSMASGAKSYLIFTVHAPEPGVYAGKIIFTYQGIKREVLILLNVVSEGVLFDATITVPDLYRVLRIGQRLPVLIELTEVGDGSGVDVTMNYVIKDFNNAVHYTESETFYVEGTKSYSKRFSTNGLESGDYILGVELVYPGGFATSSAHFKISETVSTLQTWLAIIGVFVAVMAVIVSIIFFRRKSNDKIKPFSRKNLNV